MKPSKKKIKGLYKKKTLKVINYPQKGIVKKIEPEPEKKINKFITPLLLDKYRPKGAGLHGKIVLPKILPIAGTNYPVSTVNQKIVQLLKEVLRRNNVLILEIAQGIDAKQNIIRHLIHSDALPFMEKQSRFYYIDYLEQRVRGLRRYYIRDIGRTFGEIVDILLAADIKVFLHGGIVRDLLTNTRSTDIDIVFDVGVPRIKEICEREGWPCAQVMVQEQYINFGQDKGISLEGGSIRQSFIVPIHYHEATVNDLSYDMSNQILVDFSGYGLVDVLEHRLRITPHPKYWPRWAADDFKKPLRFFKLIQKGFVPASTETLQFVINYIRDNFDSVYEKQFSLKYPVSRIKHFLIKNITMGDIDSETGEYTFGANEDKLIPFLQTIKRYVGRDIFVRMLAHFTVADLERFKTNKVITTLRGFLSSQDVMDAQAEISAAGGIY